MTQSTHNARKSVKQSNDHQKGNFPWGLMLVILFSGMALGMLIKGSLENQQGFGTGLKQLLTHSSTDDAIDPEIAEILANQSTDKVFDFYEVLEDRDKFMPKDLSEATPERITVAMDYYIQAASFRKHADAEKLRARFALKGYKSVTQAKNVKDKGTFYRVRLGPYNTKRNARSVVNKLKKLGAHGYIYSVKK